MNCAFCEDTGTIRFKSIALRDSITGKTRNSLRCHCDEGKRLDRCDEAWLWIRRHVTSIRQLPSKWWFVAAGDYRAVNPELDEAVLEVYTKAFVDHLRLQHPMEDDE